MRRKGQVTIFIILGILLLAIVGLLFYFKTLTITETFETEGRPVTVTVPQEFIAIQEYTETCLGSIAEQGLKILGQQGGYINPEDVGVYSASDPTNSDGLKVGSLSVPFWHYNSFFNGATSVQVSSLMPALYEEDDPVYSIESQLSDYIESELDSCLKSYSVFEEQGFDIEVGNKAVTTRIWDEHVDFILDFPLVLTKSGGTGELDSFYADVDVDLKHVYGVAAEITFTEQDYLFLENQFLNVLATYSRDSSEAFPPMMGVGLLKQPTISWEVANLAIKLKELLSSYVPLIQYFGSKNYYPYSYEDSRFSDIYNRMLENMVLPLNGSDDLYVNFDYFSVWEPYLQLNGGEQTIKPDHYFFKSPLGLIPFEFSQQRYVNTYDVSYPVLVTIEDPESFEGEGYKFVFSLESNIINNKPIDESYVQPPIRIEKAISLVCEDNQKDTDLITIQVVDAETGGSLSGVSVELIVPGSDRCEMGFTSNSGISQSKYPSLFGGQLELSKSGYLTQSHIIDTYFYRDEAGRFGYQVEGFDDLVIEMHPLVTKDVTINKLSLNKCLYPLPCDLNKGDCDGAIGAYCLFNSNSGSLLSGTPVFDIFYNGSKGGRGEYYLSGGFSVLDDPEKAMVIMELVNPEDSFISSDPFTATFSIKGDNVEPVELYPGIYKVTMVVLLEQSIFIPTDFRCNSEREKDCILFDGVLVESTMVGNSVFDDSVGFIEITPEDLYLNDKLTLRTITQKWLDIPGSFEVTVPSSFEIAGQDSDTTSINTFYSEDLSLAKYFKELTKEKRSKLDPKWSAYNVEESIIDITGGNQTGVLE